jgi:hypothetical protein
MFEMITRHSEWGLFALNVVGFIYTYLTGKRVTVKIESNGSNGMLK